MNPDLQKSIEEQINGLPSPIKALVLGNEWKTWVGSIVKKNSLNLDQASSLESEVFVFLIGLVNVFDLRKSIQTELNLPVSKVNDIMIDINDMIVEPLKRKLIEATEGEEEVTMPEPLAAHINLAKKEEEIMDRQKILSEIESSQHAPGVGVYTPQDMRKIEPIAQNAQISPAKEKVLITPAPQAAAQPVAEKPIAAAAAAPKPASIFEAKTSGVVAPTSIRTTAVIAEKPAPKPAPAPSSDPYREPIA